MDTKDIDRINYADSDTGSVQELLNELVKNSKKQIFYSRITVLAAITAALILIICLILIVPPAVNILNQANDILVQANETIELADTAIGEITEMSRSITNMSNNMDSFIMENSESVQQIMKKFDEIDFEGLNSAIKDLGDVVEPFANFFGKFK